MQHTSYKRKVFTMSKDLFVEATHPLLFCDKYWYTILYVLPANFFSSTDTFLRSVIGAKAVVVLNF